VHRHKRIAITPLHLDLTDTPRVAELTGWGISGFTRHELDPAASRDLP